MTRVAHITDLHLLSLDGVGPRRMAGKRLTGYLNLLLHRGAEHKIEVARAVVEAVRRDQPDHVIVTGDLTNLALEPEFELARDVLRGLDLPADRVSMVPGNHDVYTRGAYRARRFESYFADHLTSDLAVPGSDGASFPYVRVRDGLAVIGLTSAVPRVPFVASGELGDKQLRALERVLGDPSIRDLFLVLLMHHPVINPAGPWALHLRGLVDADRLVGLLGKRPALVAHGHLHLRMHRRRGPLHVLGATSASLEHRNPHRMAGYNLYELDGDQIRRAVASVLDPKSGGFSDRPIPVE